MDFEQQERSAGLQRGYLVALHARRTVKAPAADVQRAMTEAVRHALEGAIVEALYSPAFSEAFLDGLMLAVRTLTAAPGERRVRREGRR
jgi:hypothetical protein